MWDPDVAGPKPLPRAGDPPPGAPNSAHPHECDQDGTTGADASVRYNPGTLFSM